MSAQKGNAPYGEGVGVGIGGGVGQYFSKHVTVPIGVGSGVAVAVGPGFPPLGWLVAVGGGRLIERTAVGLTAGCAWLTPV